MRIAAGEYRYPTNIELNEGESYWLHGIIQNPIFDYDPTEDLFEDIDIHCRLFELNIKRGYI